MNKKDLCDYHEVILKQPYLDDILELFNDIILLGENTSWSIETF